MIQSKWARWVCLNTWVVPRDLVFFNQIRTAPPVLYRPCLQRHLVGVYVSMLARMREISARWDCVICCVMCTMESIATSGLSWIKLYETQQCTMIHVSESQVESIILHTLSNILYHHVLKIWQTVISSCCIIPLEQTPTWCKINSWTMFYQIQIEDIFIEPSSHKCFSDVLSLSSLMQLDTSAI